MRDDKGKGPNPKYEIIGSAQLKMKHKTPHNITYTQCPSGHCA